MYKKLIIIVSTGLAKAHSFKTNFAFVPQHQVKPCKNLSKKYRSQKCVDVAEIFQPNYYSRRIASRIFLSNPSGGYSENDSDNDTGNFVELGREVTKPFGPLGILTAGYSEEEVDMIVTACETAMASRTNGSNVNNELLNMPSQYLPVIIFGKSDLKRNLDDILSELSQRDCEFPADGDELRLATSSMSSMSDWFGRRSYIRYPFLLFSGFEIPELQLALRYIESLNDLNVKPMCAMAVENAMQKKLGQLVEEIEGDHDANQDGEFEM